MRVLLINPPESHTIQANLPAAVESLRGPTPPISLMCVAAAIRNSGQHDVRLLDAFSLGLTYDALETEIQRINPDVVGFSVTTFTLLDVMEAARRTKKAAPKAITIAGGLQPSIYPEQTAGLKIVDYCFSGEVDLTLPRFLETLENEGPIQEVPGLIYYKGDTLISNPPPAPVDDLDALPFPAHDLLPLDRYTSLVTDLRPVSATITSRGCPYHCAFCSHSVTGKKVRLRSPENIADEMAWCENLGIKYLMVYDEVMTINAQRVISLCELIIKRGISIKWMARARAETLTPDMLATMKKAGCDLVTLGIESGSPEVLKRLNRPTDIDALVNAFQMVHRAGLRSLAYFMVGCPGETTKDLRASLAVAKRANPDMIHASVFVPYPATDLYTEGLQTGRFEHDYWEDFSRHPSTDFHPRLWSRPGEEAAIMKKLAWFYRRFYLRPGYIIKRLRRLQGLADIKRNLRGLATILFSRTWSFSNNDTTGSKEGARG